MDPLIVPALIEGAGSLIAGGLNFAGQHRANADTRHSVREQMRFQERMSKSQMDFQERMSNTAYQRAMADMRAAGLNPILAVNQGGASTPPGASAAGANFQAQNESAMAVSSALAWRSLQAEIAQKHAETKQTKVMTKLASLDIPGKQAEADLDTGQYSVGKFSRWLQRILNPVKFLRK